MSRAALFAGVDEAGRGPLAGPVIAAAVILDPQRPLPGVQDSKKLSPRRRERLATEIRDQALAWGLGRAEVDEIDRLNILHATLLAMQRAVASLAVAPVRVLVDGNQAPALTCPVETVVRGDQKVTAIAAASILAKVARDEEMEALDAACPGYGFASHKGYPTASHLEAPRRLGPSPHHRRSYAPVRACLTSAR